MAIVKISDLPLVDSPVQGTDLFVVVQDNVTKKAYAGDVQTYVGYSEVQTATAGQTVFTLTEISYVPSANNLTVFVDGVNQYVGTSYVETDSKTVTFTQGLHVGAQVKFSTVQTLSSVNASANEIFFTPAGEGAVIQTVQAKERNVISVTDFMTAEEIADAKQSVPTLGVEAAVQKAVDYCLTFDPPAILSVPVLCRLNAPVIINRERDATNNSTFFIIRGDGISGGFYAYSGVTMFSSTLPVYSASDWAVSQKINFDNIVFKSQFPSNPTYVLDDAKFLRMRFTNCSFHRIKLLNATRFLQTYYLDNCTSYGWIGPFINGTNGAYDIKINNHIAEAGTTFYSVVCNDVYSGDPNAQISITNSLFQSINSVCIQADRAQGFDVDNCYFEGNGQDGSPDIKFDTARNLANLTPNGSIKVSGSFFSQKLANFNDPNYYSIRWGRVTTSGFAAGNYLVDLGTGAALKLHYTIPESRVVFAGEPGIPYQLYANQFIYPAAGYVMPVSGERVTIIRGVINANGTIKEGAGFTASKTATGRYTITFSSAFGDDPAVTVTLADSTGNPLCVAVASSTNAANVIVRSPASVDTDCLFHFIAVGPMP
jgi:hypothetical protein